MGILQVKRDSPYLSKNNNVNKKQYHVLLCLGVFGRCATNCYHIARNVGATNNGTLNSPILPVFPLHSDLGVQSQNSDSGHNG